LTIKRGDTILIKENDVDAPVGETAVVSFLYGHCIVVLVDNIPHTLLEHELELI
jgi:hypothetical protein